ncbi:MAG: transposase [Planctomycetaceae bacterium]|nr:transposase [Planctomycetaceae bacterium]
MIIASHVIFGAYGFWLPNDPRGSWSDFVGAWELYRCSGPVRKVETRRSVAGRPHDGAARIAAKERLKHPPVKFNGLQARAIGRGFGRFAERNQLRILACAILSEHVHLVIARHHYEVEQAVVLLKGEASRVLAEENRHPMTQFPRKNGRLPTCWARGEWKVFLNNTDNVARAVEYVERNPVKEGLPRQQWTFVRSYREFLSEL